MFKNTYYHESGDQIVLSFLLLNSSSLDTSKQTNFSHHFVQAIPGWHSISDNLTSYEPNLFLLAKALLFLCRRAISRRVAWFTQAFISKHLPGCHFRSSLRAIRSNVSYVRRWHRLCAQGWAPNTEGIVETNYKHLGYNMPWHNPAGLTRGRFTQQANKVASIILWVGHRGASTISEDSIIKMLPLHPPAHVILKPLTV